MVPPYSRKRTRLKDNFENSSWSLNDDQTSPDGRWYCYYKSQGTADVRTSTAGGGNTRTGKVVYLKPQHVEGQTRAAFVRNTTLWSDFECVFDMRTVSQNRPVSPNNWEVSWIIFRFTDNWHHYYMLIQADGGLELGRKDYAEQIEQQQFLVTNANNAPTFVMGKWYNIRLRCEKNKIKVWIDGVLQCDITDDGSFGFDSLTSGNPPPPTQQLMEGYFAFYSEDAEVEYDNFAIRSLV